MSDDPNRKKSLREQVEDFKRGQRLAEEKAAKSEDDLELDEDEEEAEDADDHAWAKDIDPVAAAAEARKSGASLVRTVSAIFLMAGAVLLVVSAATFWFTRQSVAAEVSAEGVVVKNVLRAHTSRDSSSSRQTTSDYYHAVVEFPLADGSRKTVEMSEGSWPKAYDEGEKVTVRYNPQRPLTARLGGGSALDFLASLITGFLGLVFTTVAIGIRRAFA